MSFLHRIFNTLRAFVTPEMTDEQRKAGLDALADAYYADHGVRLDPENSVVDTMKALGFGTSRAERVELANDLNYDGDAEPGSAVMNTWLKHKLWDAYKQHKFPGDAK